jgi:hypothetical protein
MEHHRADPIDADLGVFDFAIPQLVRSRDFHDDHCLRRIRGRIARGDTYESTAWVSRDRRLKRRLKRLVAERASA